MIVRFILSVAFIGGTLLHFEKFLMQYFKILCTGDVDYSSGPYNVIIPSGQISVPFDVPINDDNVFEENEEFFLTIDQSSSLNGVIIGSPNVTVVNISDNDGKKIS